MYELPKGSRKIEPAEFWKPTKPGDTVIGKIARFGENTFADGNKGRNITLEPVVVWPVAGEPGGFGSVAVGLNTSLQTQITDSLKDHPVVIKYLGSKRTPGGPTPMRMFGVAVLPQDEWARLYDQFFPKGEAAAATPAAEEGDDILPF